MRLRGVRPMDGPFSISDYPFDVDAHLLDVGFEDIIANTPPRTDSRTQGDKSLYYSSIGVMQNIAGST